MKKLHALAIAVSLLLVPAGCSQETVDQAREAGEATGEAIEGAAEDTAENVDQAAQSVDEQIDVDVNDDAAEPDAAENETP